MYGLLFIGLNARDAGFLKKKSLNNKKGKTHTGCVVRYHLFFIIVYYYSLRFSTVH